MGSAAMSARDDVLAGMTAAQRRRRQLEDARYINDKMQGSIKGSPEAIAAAKSIGSGVLAAPTEQYLPGAGGQNGGGSVRAR